MGAMSNDWFQVVEVGCNFGGVCFGQCFVEVYDTTTPPVAVSNHGVHREWEFLHDTLGNLENIFMCPRNTTRT